jgi:hypothetical protein
MRTENDTNLRLRKSPPSSSPHSLPPTPQRGPESPSALSTREFPPRTVLEDKASVANRQVLFWRNYRQQTLNTLPHCGPW